ncbi:hypothetical protein [Microbacterium oleivorans]|uniref:NTP pyrophosphohydrolase n=1 Tax=Microbacterium oleivorans TaxID=273677 RepID=A0A177K6N0_9MICO|nr:hypothetical protein [Microbacterium oleivorans]OAH49059.1 hypothetical protein AYL44_13720 [Microbacterium oleivorans]
MTTPTHIVQLNGFARSPLVDVARPYEDQIRFSVRRMDGAKLWAYSLWRAPDGADLLAEIPFSEEYIQCAGDAEGVTVEVRVVDEAGTAHQYTVGKPTGGDDAEPTETIRWDEGRHSTKVHPHEVFSLDEAADLFVAYYRDNHVPSDHTLREI